MTIEFRHNPVLLAEVLRELDPQPGEVVCDCTLGGAGHSVELARKVAPDGLAIGIDQDVAAIRAASERLDREAPETEHLVLQGNFSQLDDLLVGAEVPGVDCFLFDLGVSSPQLDDPERGFSYRQDGPLSMVMHQGLGNHTTNAAEVINTTNEKDLAQILRMYGDERYATRIAHAIVREREREPIEGTLRLAEIVRNAIPAAARRHGGHPAKRSFQAIRIYVNRELEVLEQGLRAAIRWMNPGGRICVISYHSLEDRIVKHLFAEMSQGCTCPPDLPVCVCGNVPILDVRTRRPIKAGKGELEENPRARSALMRVAERRRDTGA